LNDAIEKGKRNQSPTKKKYPLEPRKHTVPSKKEFVSPPEEKKGVGGRATGIHRSKKKVPRKELKKKPAQALSKGQEDKTAQAKPG